MDLHCRYHPTRVPVLICTQCATTVCPDCIPKWPDHGYPRCVTCMAEMEPLGISEYVKPFWQCFDRFFKYPFLKGNLMFMGLVLLLTFIVPLPHTGMSNETISVFGLIYRIITWLLFPSFIVAYLASVTLSASEGNSLPPRIDSAWKTGGFSLFFKFIATFWLFAFYAGLVSVIFGNFLSMLFYAMGALAFPGVMMLLVMEKSVGSALNFKRVIFVMTSIGWPYAFLWGLIVMLMSGPDMVTDLLHPLGFSLFYVRLGILINVVFGLIMFYLLGYVAYQYHYELGYSLPKEQLSELKNNKTKTHPILIEAELLIADGHYHSAIKLLQTELDGNPNQELLWSKLFKLTELTMPFEHIMKMATKYMKVLYEKSNYTGIIQVIRRLQRTRANLALTDFSSPERISQLLTDQNELDLLATLS